MREKLIQNLEERFRSYADFVCTVDPADVAAKLDVPKDKSVAEHLWCVVGSRESYAKALGAGAWQGFSCSMKAYEREHFESALAASGATLLAAIAGVREWSPAHDELLLGVAEHEVMHEGQLIRHMYGLGRTLPSSWRWA